MMEYYEWITLDIYDPESDQDYMDINYALIEDACDRYSDLSKVYFPFIIRKQIEEKGNIYKRYAVPIGFLFLKANGIYDDILLVECGLILSEQEKKYMKQGLDIFNKKLNGETMTEYQWKREYESLMNNFNIVASVPINYSKLNHLCECAELVCMGVTNNYYIFSYKNNVREDMRDKLLTLDRRY